MHEADETQERSTQSLEVPHLGLRCNVLLCHIVCCACIAAKCTQFQAPYNMACDLKTFRSVSACSSTHFVHVTLCDPGWMCIVLLLHSLCPETNIT